MWMYLLQPLGCFTPLDYGSNVCLKPPDVMCVPHQPDHIFTCVPKTVRPYVYVSPGYNRYKWVFNRPTPMDMCASHTTRPNHTMGVVLTSPHIGLYNSIFQPRLNTRPWVCLTPHDVRICMYIPHCTTPPRTKRISPTDQIGRPF